MNTAIGAALIVLGLLGLAWGGINYTSRDTVVDLGPIHATAERHHTLPIPPIAGTILLIGGVALLAMTRKA